MFKKILIANRSEVAVRIIRACRELGIASVAVYSEADADAVHVTLADEAVCLGPAEASQSYLDQQKVLQAARDTGCDALHPGYGFLAENAGFARLVTESGIHFIGPTPESMDRMGAKIPARETALLATAPVVPGFDREGATDDEYIAAAAQIGYPVMVKASMGGGGKGMRIVDSEAELQSALDGARREAAKAFGDPTVFLEKYIQNPRHIEIQVLADRAGNTLHLGERECSVQRRHQKIVEETPSTAVDNELRAKMGADAVAIARAVGYEGAGTVEFIMDPAGGYYFLEMNTRLQVEHPVTEFVYGLDIVQWQIRIATGEALPFSQEQITPRGHSIECRICAEDAASGFLPQVGSVQVLREPQGPGVRLDSMLKDGLAIGADYDPMLAKLIVHAEDREAAIRRMQQALSDMCLLGVTSNLGILAEIIAHPAFAGGETDTGFIARHFSGYKDPEPGLPERIAAALAASMKGSAVQRGTTNDSGHADPFRSYGNWSNA
ncbi:MAG: acetyl-CoA carboxylase biotin carboxylase subunit [Planctomycetales bacterium]|nr:acetyl-CoA carboxylase biotin carboxylase subunit [bacterium]UNM07405.1 MAG: acetyl-CoA carboxylase biotin carboxylase subunit [Planctomycetales bacterium]